MLATTPRRSGMPRCTMVCRAARSRMAASFCSAAEPVEKVRVDLLQEGHLLGIGPQDRAADAGFSEPVTTVR